MDSDVTRRHQRDKTSRWCRREHAMTGADQTPGPRPVTLSRRAARCWPSAGLCGGQLAVSSHVPWIVGGRLPLRGNRGPWPVRASVFLSRILVEAGVHTCRTPPRACSVRQSVKCQAGTYSSYHVQQRLRYVQCWSVLPLGAAVQRQPRKKQCGDRGLGCWPRGHVKKGEGTPPG